MVAKVVCTVSWSEGKRQSRSWLQWVGVGGKSVSGWVSLLAGGRQAYVPRRQIELSRAPLVAFDLSDDAALMDPFFLFGKPSGYLNEGLQIEGDSK